jgi:hypothetical protein
MNIGGGWDLNLPRNGDITQSSLFLCKVSSDEAIKLIEAGFDYVTGEYNDGGKLFRKRK